MGHNVYRQLGFRDCCTYRLYHWPGTADEHGGGTTAGDGR